MGLLVSQDAEIDGSLSAKPFIDNMIHVISERGSQIDAAFAAESQSFQRDSPSRKKGISQFVWLLSSRIVESRFRAETLATL